MDVSLLKAVRLRVATQRFFINNLNCKQMSKSINKVFLSGNIGRDPEVRSLSDGTKVADFPLATSNGGFTTKDGKEVPEVTQWHTIVLWRGLAEYAEKYLKKGYGVTVIGEITYRKYNGKDGVERMATDIIATEMYLGGEPRGNGSRPSDPSQYAQPTSIPQGAEQVQQSQQAEYAEEAGRYDANGNKLPF